MSRPAPAPHPPAPHEGRRERGGVATGHRTSHTQPSTTHPPHEQPVPLKVHPESHTDHVSPKVLEWVLNHPDFQGDLTGLVIKTLEYPEDGVLDCDLHGPLMGDPPVPDSDVVHKRRPVRSYTSRLVDRPVRSTRLLTVIAGPHAGDTGVLFTLFGGPVTPREPNDPTLANLPEHEREASVAFWSQHALSRFPV